MWESSSFYGIVDGRDLHWRVFSARGLPASLLGGGIAVLASMLMPGIAVAAAAVVGSVASGQQWSSRPEQVGTAGASSLSRFG